MTVERLATSGAKIVIISDYPSTASAIMEDLCRKGFDTSLFVGAITTEDLRRDHFLRFDFCIFKVMMYKSATVMADVDAADRRIVVGGDFYCIKAANAARISSIFITGGLHTFANTTDVLNHAVIRDAHPTYVLPFFTW
ncbi:Hypothetical predicted protein [Olea europaea subsp. europaea]|uniref:Uncharacterized protein n=1 Tax=Olea europaea subsp. europaea TaxID=158383 RepID=A0A8S0UJ46_OLEEU|nr:Hypothetical predicted protein [Olea europaea subsp. europaea]